MIDKTCIEKDCKMLKQCKTGQKIVKYSPNSE
jgi:hypothetical protein